jgi:hypothetical protein
MNAGKMAKSSAAAVLNKTNELDSSNKNLSLLKQIWWSSSRVNGLKSLMKLVDILNDLGIEFSKVELFNPEI